MEKKINRANGIIFKLIIVEMMDSQSFVVFRSIPHACLEHEL